VCSLCLLARGVECVAHKFLKKQSGVQISERAGKKNGDRLETALDYFLFSNHRPQAHEKTAGSFDYFVWLFINFLRDKLGLFIPAHSHGGLAGFLSRIEERKASPGSSTAKPGEAHFIQIPIITLSILRSLVLYTPSPFESCPPRFRRVSGG